MKYALVFLLAASCSFWGCSRGGSSDHSDRTDKITDQAEEAAKDMGDAAKEVGTAAKEAAKGMGEAVKDAAKSVAEAVDPGYPGKAATHVITLDRVKLSERDFHMSTLGHPVDVQIDLLENGSVIESNSRNVIDGERGERTLEQPVQWTVKFMPDNTYQIRVAETSIIADKSSWLMPAHPKAGYLLVAANGGMVRLTRDSYVHFSDRVVQ